MRSLTVAVISLAFLGTSCARPRTQEEISNERMIRELPRFAEESVQDPERRRKVKSLAKQTALGDCHSLVHAYERFICKK